MERLSDNGIIGTHGSIAQQVGVRPFFIALDPSTDNINEKPCNPTKGTFLVGSGKKLSVLPQMSMIRHAVNGA
jgi:hypothetical protein